MFFRAIRLTINIFLINFLNYKKYYTFLWNKIFQKNILENKHSKNNFNANQIFALYTDIFAHMQNMEWNAARRHKKCLKCAP